MSSMSAKIDFSSVRPLLDASLPQLYIETYGCQMNLNDSEVVLSLMQQAGYSLTKEISKADVIFVNTCSIRDNAEQRIWGRLDAFMQEKKRRRRANGEGTPFMINNTLWFKKSFILLKKTIRYTVEESYRISQKLILSSTQSSTF